MKKYKGTFNWYGEISIFYTSSVNEHYAFGNCIGKLAKKLKRSYRDVYFYFAGTDRYKIEEVS